MDEQQLKQEMIKGMFLVASQIREVAPINGFYALRKAGAVNADMPLKELIRTGDDIMMIAKKNGLDL